MAGFLDKQSQIIDMVMTNHGREALSQGTLDFSYWIPFDDEIDYDPYISQSGSLSSAQLSASIIEQIEYQPIREATTGYRQTNPLSLDLTCARHPIFSMPQGHVQVPTMSDSGALSSGTIEVKQQKILEQHKKTDKDGKSIVHLGPYDRGTKRFDPSTFSLELDYIAGSWNPGFQPDGFLIRIFSSGSDGLVEVKEKRDLSNRISYNQDLILKVENMKKSFSQREKK